MGLGVLGLDAALALKGLGFRVSGWSASPKQITGIDCFSGEDGFEPFLQRTNILVCLLPLTASTRQILNRKTFSMLDGTSPLGAPVLINAGRGGLQVEADLVDCLDDGTLGAATLDVFETEPLPPESALWRHPKVVVTPHNAADTDPVEISKFIARQIDRFEAGEALDNIVDPARGY
jgi:glyoxylate/hydroxypyruvate reductase A